MNVALPRTKAESAYLEAVSAGDAGPQWLKALRRAGYESFAGAGLPHRRLEDWKWFDLRQIADQAYPPALPSAAPAAEVDALVARSPFAKLARARLVFVNGAFDEGRSQLPASGDVEFVRLGGDGAPRWLTESVAADGKDPISALNAAFVSDGGAIRIAAGATADAPIEMVFVSTAGEPSTLTTRNVIVLEEGASATIIETHLGGSEAYVANSVTEARLGKGARLDRVKLEAEGEGAIHLANFHADVGENATLRDFTLTIGGRAIRQQGFVTVSGEGADVGVSGAYLLSGRQHADTRLVVDHAVPHGTSRELFKCVMDDSARGVFQGKVIVRPQAQKTDGKQSSHALLLSERAEFDAKPELEIYADDVVCGHGATSRELDETQLFYLNSRGIPEVEAKSLLIAAFVGESFDTVNNEAIRDELIRMTGEWLAERSPGMTAAAASTPAKAFDVERIRADFPILGRSVYGKPLVYLDNAASAQKPRQVIEAIRNAYEDEYANVHRGLHFLSNTATQNFEDARESVRRFLNAPSTDQIVFTRNATEAINLVAQSFGGLRIGEGDEIVLSIMEHHSNIVPWHFHRERKGAVLKWAPVDDDGNFLLDEFEKLLGPRTRMVAITHMSNALGTIVPVKEVIRLAHARGIPVLVDGSQAAVHMPVDVADLDCDFYVFTGHKAYGPTGIGALYAKPEHLAAMPPYQGGGEMIREVFQDEITYADPPHRFEAGTPAIVQAIGLGAALDYMESIGREAIAGHEADLLAYADEQLKSINSLKIHGQATNRGAIVSFTMEGAHPHDIATVIDRQGVAVRAGTHCTMPLLERYGLSASCRASFAMYNTRADVDRLVEALQSARRLFM